ncbi:MAG: ATP-binding protein [Bacteroidota bacterium]
MKNEDHSPLQIYRRYIAFLIFQLLVVSIVTGQPIASPSTYTSTIQYFDAEEKLAGLPPKMVVTDRRGVVWMSTDGGLLRFDGETFKLYALDQGAHPNKLRFLVLIGDELWCEHTDSNGYNTFGDISIFHTIEERIIPWEAYQPPFSKDKITNFRIEPQTSSLFLHVQQEDSTALYEVNAQREFLLKKTIPDGFFYSGDPNRGHILFEWETAHFQQFDQAGNLSQTVSLVGSIDSIAFCTVYGYPKEVGVLWLYTELGRRALEVQQLDSTGKLRIWDHHKRLIRQLYPRTTDKEIETWRLKYIPKYDAFAMAFRQVFFIIRANGELMHLTYLDGVKNAFDIVGITNDYGIFWVSNGEGLYQLNLHKNLFNTYLTDQNISFRGITGNPTHLYFNAYQGIYELDKKNGQTSRVDASGIGGYLAGDTLWYGSNPGIAMLNVVTKEQVEMEVPSSQEIWSFYQDEQDQLWYSWYGLHAFDNNTGSVTPAAYHAFPELADHPIYHFYPKEDGKVLLCARSGLYEWHPQKGVLARYWKEGKGQFQLPVTDIRHLYYDATDASYWLATGKKGLVHWWPEKGESEVYPLHRNRSNTVHSVYPDAYHNLWLSTDNGLIQFDKATKLFRVYLPADGTSSDEFNRISHFQDADSTLYFGSVDGVTVVRPKDFAKANFAETPTEVVILQVEQYLATSNRLENITTDFYQTQQIRMESGDRFFTLLLTLNQPSYLSDVVYQYRLKGVDAAWTVAKSNELSISGIPYGRQILEIKASMSNGQFTKVLEVPVRVLRPFYLQWWFWLLMVLLGVVSTMTGIYWRTQRLQAQQLYLRKEVQKRTATIQQQAEKLQALYQTKSRFFANVSHELRTPLTLILGPVQSILKRGRLDQQDGTMLEKANQSGQQLLKLVGSILDLSKMEADRMELQEEAVVLFPFIRRLVSNFESHAQQEGIRFSFAYQAEQELQVLLDQDKLEVILNNLLSNAIKFTPAGGQIEVVVQYEAKLLQIRVTDTGRGIHSDDLPKVFDRFYQSNQKQAPTEGGTGIGLALSREYAKLMDGKLWAASEWKVGSTFFLQIPRKEVLGMVEAHEEEALAAITAKTIESTPLESPRVDHDESVLVVEDNRALRDYLQLLLAPHYNIQTAKNGQVALAMLLENEQQQHPQPNLILSDVMMPVLDGFQLVTALKANASFRTIPIIMLTARAESKDKLTALRIGVDDYLLKPFDEEELLVRIENLLSNAAHRRSYLHEMDQEGTTTAKEAATISPADSEWLVQLEDVLQASLGDFKLSADKVAQALFIGRTQLFQKIKRLTGLTPNQYIKEVRLNRARDLLIDADTTTSVKQVAYEVGFKDTKNFSRNFKKRFGKSPSEYLQ